MRNSLLKGAVFAAFSGVVSADEEANTVSDRETWHGEIITVSAERVTGYESDSAAVSRMPVALSEIPQSIQVLTPTLLKEQQLSTLSEALTNVSGVVPSAPSEVVLANPIIRGFEAEIFVDGLMGYGDTAVIDPASLSGVERVEVAKGPTSVLFGGGTGAPVGGLINVVTKTPKKEAFLRASVRAGSFNSFTPSIDLNLPLTDVLSVRVPAEYHRSDDYIDAVDVERVTFNPSVSVSLGEGTGLLFRGGYNRIEQLEYVGLPAVFADVETIDPYQYGAAPDTPDTVIENLSLHATLSHEFSSMVSASLQVRRYESKFREFSATPFFAFYPIIGTTAPIITGQLPVDTKEWTIDGSLTAEFYAGSIRHTLLVGATYDDTQYEGSTGFNLFPVGVFDYTIQAPLLNYGTPPVLTSTQINDYKTLAFYLQDHLSVSERFHVMAGARLSSYEMREIEGGQGTDETWTRFDPRIGAVLDLVEGVSLYAGWSTGSRLSLFFVSATGNAPELETSESLEAGFKFNSEETGLSGTIGGFRLTRENVPTPDPTTFITSIQSGKQESQGIEADLIWEPSEQVSFLVSAAYTDANVTADTNIPAGSKLRRVPDFSGRFAARYRFGGALEGLGVGAGVTWASEAELTLPNRLQSGGYVLVDVQASYAWDRFSIGLTVQNLFGEDYTTPYSYFAQAVIRPGMPRAAFATFTVDF